MSVYVRQAKPRTADDDLSRGYYFFLMGRVFSENYMGLSDGRGEVSKNLFNKNSHICRVSDLF